MSGLVYEVNTDPERVAESNTEMIMSVLSVFHFVALVFVSLRLYARVVVIKSPGKDDWTMVLAALFAFGGGWITFLLQSQRGLGKHTDTISREDKVIFDKLSFWQSVLSATCALGLLKISIAFNLLRLSKSRWYKLALWATIVFVSCYSFMGLMTFFLYCKPMHGYWDRSIPRNCYPITLFVTFGLVNTSFNIFTDVLFAIFPIPIIWSLQMKLKMRLYLIGILSLGYLAVAMGIVKAVFQFEYGKERDPTFRQSVQFWGFLQLNIGIIAACATSLKPLVSRILGLHSTDKYNSTPAQYGYGTSRSGKHGTLRSRGTRIIDSTDAPGLQFEMQDASKPDLSNGHAKTNTSVSFYKHGGSASGSGSEEMILGTSPPPPVGGAPVDRGIMRTTEVQISVGN